jgi:pimeloyl-ACP methyl ester carboxylesterase
MRHAICRLLWKMWSPDWNFSDIEYALTAQSFHNPDFVDTVVHSYRDRYGNAEGHPALEALETQLARQPTIPVPTIVLHGEQDRVDPPSSSKGQEHLFSSHYERRLIAAAGHCLTAESPY